MKLSYKKLWKLLIDREIKHKDLISQSEIMECVEVNDSTKY